MADEEEFEYIAPGLRSLAVPIDSLVPLKRNPRRGHVEGLKRSLSRFGQRRAATIREDTREVTAGNHMMQAMTELGYTHIAVVSCDDDELTAQAWAAADNWTHEIGDYDDAELREQLLEIAENDMDLIHATGISDEDLERLLDVGELVTELEPFTGSLDGPARPAADPDDLPARSTPAPETPAAHHVPRDEMPDVIVDDEDDDFEPFNAYEGYSGEGGKVPGASAGGDDIAAESDRWVVLRVADLRLRVKREAYERLYDELLRNAKGDRIGAMEEMGRRLGLDPDDFEARKRIV